jgi:hypothetical protein
LYSERVLVSSRFDALIASLKRRQASEAEPSIVKIVSGVAERQRARTDVVTPSPTVATSGWPATATTRAEATVGRTTTSGTYGMRSPSASMVERTTVALAF